MMQTTIKRTGVGGIGMWLAMVVAAGWCGVADADERTPSQLLEKGIYTEETVGDLDKAIEIYQQAIDSAQANRTILAQAQLRLGLCFLKQGKDDKGTEVLQKLIDEYADQPKIVAQAREHIPEAPQPLQLLPAPWTDGEILSIDMKLPGGQFIGVLFSTAEKMTVDGRNIWRIGLRRFFGGGGIIQAASSIDADAETFVPFTSSMKHSLLGDFDGKYGKDRVVIVSHPEGSERVRTLEFKGATYDNDQSPFLMRRMPLAVGYKTTMSLVPIFTGTQLSLGVEVTAIETVTVPAGTFDCYKVELDPLPAVYWISTDASRYLVKFEDSGIVGELGEIAHRSPNETVAYQDTDFGFSLTVPAGWYHRRLHGTVRDPQAKQGQVVFFDPEADLKFGTVEVRPAKDGWTLAKVAERELEGVKRRFKDYTLRPESWQERSIAGSPAISFAGDYKEGSDDYVQYRVYMLDRLKIEFIFKVAAERFDDFLPSFDGIVSSFQTE